MIGVKLREEGWNIKADFLADLQTQNYQSVVQLLKNTDLKECGSVSLPSEIGKGKSSQIKLPVVLQVCNVRNVAAPKAHEESGAAPRMLRITLTDGVNYIQGLEISSIQSLSLKTAPGTKLKIHSKISVAGGHFLLDPSNVFLVGGVVDELFQKWKLSQSALKCSRAAVNSLDGSGPPIWVPFGQKILNEQDQDFKALGDVGPKRNEEDDDFKHQREKTVLELSKESSQKVFGGGKQMLDSSVQKIINYGPFTIEEAECALKRNKHDVHRAIQELKRVQGGEDPDEYQTEFPSASEDRGRMKRGRGRSRGRVQAAGPDGSDDEMPHMGASRPSRPASLLDYLESRILDKTESQNESRYASHDDERGGDFFKHGRGRRRGARGDFKQKPAMRQSEAPLAAENWPSLNQEMDTGAKRQQSRETNTASHYAHEEIRTNHYEPNNPSTRYSHQPNYRHTSSYRDNNSSYYREKPVSYQAQQSSSSYRDNAYHQHQEERQPVFRNESSNRYEESERSVNAQQHYRPNREEQNYYTRGMGRAAIQRGNNTYNRDYSRGQGSYPRKSGPPPSSHYNQPHGERSEYFSSEGHSKSGGEGSSTNRGISTKAQELVADFEKSMVMHGLYEAPTCNSQNRNSYYETNKPNYSNYNYQDVSGIYEYPRGGDYSRSTRGRRGGRY